MSIPDHRRLRELFHQVIQLPEQERPQFLETACANDPVQLRAIVHLLDYHRTSTLLASGVDTSFDGDSQVSTEVDGVRPALSRSSAFFSRASHAIPWNKQWATWLLVVACVALVGWLGRRVELAVRRQLEPQIATSLQTILAEQVLALQIWLDAELRLLSNWGKSSELAQTIAELDAATRGSQAAESWSVKGQPLRDQVLSMSSGDENLRYKVWNRDFRQIADSDPTSPTLGNPSTDFGSRILGRVFRGQSILWTPSSEGFITSGVNVNTDPDQAAIAIIVPVFDFNQRVIAALMIGGTQLQTRFESLLRQARHGDSGEAYAIDRNGFFITEGRFNSELKTAGLIPDTPHSRSSLILRVAVPQRDIRTSGKVNISTIQEWPLTKAARIVTRKEAGSDISGYVGYRGVEVVGAWQWLDEYQFGIIVEIDSESAFRPLLPLRNSLRGLLFFLGLAGLVGLIVLQAKRRQRRPRGLNSPIGPYHIEHRLDEGGSGQVYLATHNLLKRPTALKLLKPAHVNDVNLLRFQREVQLACRLSHANTIEIYDYGMTAHGEFYCAMEFIAGFNLQTLVEIEGALPVARVVHILLGVCNSLNEAHQLGLIHRDIKPHNIMLCQKGGQADFVKVLDFGLAREIAPQVSSATDTQLLVGTPMFIAPERIADPSCIDPRSDIFSLGIVGFILLTGSEPHAAANSVDALLQTMRENPVPPSRTALQSIPAELDQLICDCQARNPEQRPQTVQQVIDRLQSLPIAAWSQEAARQWWTDFGALLPQINPPTNRGQ